MYINSFLIVSYTLMIACVYTTAKVLTRTDWFLSNDISNYRLILQSQTSCKGSTSKLHVITTYENLANTTHTSPIVNEMPSLHSHSKVIQNCLRAQSSFFSHIFLQNMMEKIMVVILHFHTIAIRTLVGIDDLQYSFDYQ